jgi:DNA-binding response OmpR family regulator
MPSPVQAACWLDIKRVYMELRPVLRRVYMTVCDLLTYAPSAQGLGLVPIDRAHVEIDGVMYHTAMLDMGPGSVDGWLTRLAATELGVEEDGVLDVGARELSVGGHRIGLTKLEFGVMHYLCQREGRAVSRADLIESVWGYDYHGGSNVVDVVVRSLRNKLAERASVLQTVRGAGYRYRGSRL